VNDRWLWAVIFLLGCYHGINPGMGWLFAVSFGLQERKTRAVLRAIVPIALGHIVSVAIVVALGVVAVLALPHRAVHLAGAALLLGFGAYRLIRARHPRWVGMRVGFADLALWSFLMSSAHGAGLMLLPFIAVPHAAANEQAMSMSMSMPVANGGTHAIASNAAVWIVAVHALGYLLILTLVALLIYWKLGLSILRTAWFNVDLLWAVALIATGLVALFT
jgi:hypothetical protein